ncbi:MAG: TetR family transcriptional regulator [Gammaproteobacteria bacterium]|jgi:AcrR family transcriptional regulator|nr:TetR family transcriptional regulator [Gammaproteobacteria bacterium]
MIVSERLHRTQEERTALSDRLLVEAAIELLVQRGLAGTTLAAIGERAGYSRGLVTHRFGSKAGLLAHVHDTVARHWIERVQGEVGAAIGLLALEKVVQALYGFIAEAPDEIRAMYLLRYASIDPAAEYRANVARVHRAQRQDVQRWIEAGQTAGEITSKVEAALGCGAVLRDGRWPGLSLAGQSNTADEGIARSTTFGYSRVLEPGSLPANQN